MSFGRGIFAAVLISAVTFFCSFSKQTSSDKDVKLKAMFAYNFSKYAKWKSESSKTHFNVGVMDENSTLYEDLRKISVDRKTEERTYSCDKITQLDETSKLDMLVLSHGAMDPAKALRYCQENSILLITDHEDNAYSMINFVKVHGDKLKFDINTKNLKNASIEVDQALIQLANQVIE